MPAISTPRSDDGDMYPGGIVDLGRHLEPLVEQPLQGRPGLAVRPLVGVRDVHGNREGDLLGDAQRVAADADGVAEHHDLGPLGAAGQGRGHDVRRRHQPVRALVVLVDGDPVEAKLVRVLELVQVPLVELVAELRVEVLVRERERSRPTARTRGDRARPRRILAPAAGGTRARCPPRRPRAGRAAARPRRRGAGGRGRRPAGGPCHRGVLRIQGFPRCVAGPGTATLGTDGGRERITP